MAYAPGTIRPTDDASSLDDAVRAQYQRWKAAYLKNDCGGVYVRTGGAAGELTDSSTHGYGMLIAVLMAGADPEAQANFDGMHQLMKRYPSVRDPALMAWGINMGCLSPRDGDSTTAGDLDMAFALLLADKQWGSGGAIDYLAEAKRVIAAIRRSEINAMTRLPLLGDWSTPDELVFYYIVRSSDLMTDHLRAFAEVSAAGTWTPTLDASYQLIDRMQTSFAPSTGLVPDFIKDTNTTPRPVPLTFANDPKYLGQDLKAAYDHNACRVPWRLGTDYVTSGDDRARVILARINSFIKLKTGGDPTRIVDGYDLTGTSPAGAAPNDCFTASFGVGAMIDAANQAWVDDIWAELASADSSDHETDSVRLLAMLVLSGNWWAPQRVN